MNEPKIKMLDDDCLLMVFKLVNLNDRASLRAVNKHFKQLCDSIPINKLIVYERAAVETGKLIYTDEAYGYEDTASCFDLQKLFTNKTLLKQMQRLRVLVIHGNRQPATQFDLDAKFDQLDYLMLHQMYLHRPTILQSSQIKHLILELVYLKGVDELNSQLTRLAISGPSFVGDTLSVHAFGLDHLQSKGLKFLRLKPNRPLEFDFFNYCVQNKLFDSLEELELMIDDLKSLLLLSENCANIKVINAITPGHYELFEAIAATDMQDFFRRTRKDLKVYLFGIEFNKSTVDGMQEFLRKFEGSKMRVNCANLECEIDSSLHNEIKEFEKSHDLTRFYRLVGQLFFFDQIKDPDFFKKFVNCETIRFDIGAEPEADFPEYYDLFPNKKCVRIGIHGLREIKFSNAFLNEIPKRCPRIFVLMLDCKNKALKFNFLFKFEQLASIVLNTAFPFDQSTYIELIRKMKRLFILDVRWVSTSIDRAQLKSFKERVTACLSEEKPNNDLEFKIEIHKKKTESFVRYILRPKELPIPVDEEEKLYAWSKVAQMMAQHPGGYYSVLGGLSMGH